jgi:hypothetical protein
MKKFVLTVLTIFSLCGLINCSQPIGTLEGGGGVRHLEDSFWLVPRRQLYQIDERFYRNEDFQIFMVENGGVVEIPPETPGVTVEISGNLYLSTEFHDLLANEVPPPPYSFHRVGRHIVNVEYEGREGRYSLEVFSPNNGNSIGGDEGIGIIWKD